jgi:hypothetical protein
MLSCANDGSTENNRKVSAIIRLFMMIFVNMLLFNKLQQNKHNN